MSVTESQSQPNAEKSLGLMELIETALMAKGLEDFAERFLYGVTRITQSSSAFLYLDDSKLPIPQFFHYGLQPEKASMIEKLCTEHHEQISENTDLQPASVFTGKAYKKDDNLIVFPLRTEKTNIGLIGLAVQKDTIHLDFVERLLHLMAHTFTSLSERLKSEKQLSNLNMYLNISSLLAQSLDIHELLEITLHCCMEAVSAEASSVLLLDDEKKNLIFYQTEGPAKPVLKTAIFPSDSGIAGNVLHSQEPEIINDVYNDPRFYGKIDSDTGFKTKNMIVIPLAAGEEKIGVLEVLNKTNGASFTEEEKFLLLLIAEEIAFAIRNAKMFEYVVNSYCKQRQGLATCKGCQRPLGTWTPCVKYRESDI